jgi:hypothetical protein
MTPIDIGDLSLEPTADGQRLRLTIAEQQPTTTLSVEGAMALWAYLYDWLWSYAQATQNPVVHPHASWES